MLLNDKLTFLLCNGMDAKYCYQRVCMSDIVSPLVYLGKSNPKLRSEFSVHDTAVWSSSNASAVHYVLYRFVDEAMLSRAVAYRCTDN